VIRMPASKPTQVPTIGIGPNMNVDARTGRQTILR
jgi:hypothetical protein